MATAQWPPEPPSSGETAPRGVRASTRGRGRTAYGWRLRCPQVPALIGAIGAGPSDPGRGLQTRGLAAHPRSQVMAGRDWAGGPETVPTPAQLFLSEHPRAWVLRGKGEGWTETVSELLGTQDCSPQGWKEEGPRPEAVLLVPRETRVARAHPFGLWCQGTWSTLGVLSSDPRRGHTQPGLRHPWGRPPWGSLQLPCETSRTRPLSPSGGRRLPQAETGGRCPLIARGPSAQPPRGSCLWAWASVFRGQKHPIRKAFRGGQAVSSGEFAPLTTPAPSTLATWLPDWQVPPG